MLYVNRSPIRYGFRAGAKAIRYIVNIALVYHRKVVSCIWRKNCWVAASSNLRRKRWEGRGGEARKGKGLVPFILPPIPCLCSLTFRHLARRLLGKCNNVVFYVDVRVGEGGEWSVLISKVFYQDSPPQLYVLFFAG